MMLTVRYWRYNTAATRAHNLECALDGQRAYTNGLGRRTLPPTAVQVANTALPKIKPRLRRGVVVGVFTPTKAEPDIRNWVLG